MNQAGEASSCYPAFNIILCQDLLDIGYFRLNIKKLIALAFIPLDQIITGFDLIVNQLDDDDADVLTDYFEKTWIGQPKRRANIFLHS